MSYIQSRVLTAINAKTLFKFLLLASLAALLPFFINQQWLTGPMVNAILILTLFLVGLRSAVILCFIPSLMALAGGLLPAIMAPVLPFIMLGNVIYVLTIDWLYNNFKDANRSYWIGLAVGSSLKFLFIYLSVSLIAGRLLNNSLVHLAMKMVSWPQLMTALTGGMIAWIILKWVGRIRKK